MLAQPRPSPSLRACHPARAAVLWLAIAGCTLIGGCDRGNPPVSHDGAANDAREAATLAGQTDRHANGGVHRVNGSPVSATLKLEPHQAKPGEEVTLTVELVIEPLWEVRALDGQPSAMATRLDLELPEGVAAEGDWEAPQATRSMLPDGHSVYVGEAVFRRRLRVSRTASAGRDPIKCRLRYQACNDRLCLEPSAVELAVTLKVE